MLKINTRVKFIQCACRATDPILVGLEGIIIGRGMSDDPPHPFDWTVKVFNFALADKVAAQSCMLRPIIDPKADEFLNKCRAPHELPTTKSPEKETA